METKQCSKCKEVKPVSEFYKDKAKKDGLRPQCKECKKKHYQENKDKISEWGKKHYQENKKTLIKKYKKYYQENKERENERSRKYRKENKEKISKQRKEHYQKNKERINRYNNKYHKKRRTKDPLFKLSCRIRKLIGNSIKGKGYTKKSKTHDILGISYEGFKKHIEKQFTEGMSWSNQGEWEYDHIIPISSHSNEEEIHLLNHHLNLQPLWKKDNRTKSDKYTEEDKQAMLTKIKLWKK